MTDNSPLAAADLAEAVQRETAKHWGDGLSLTRATFVVGAVISEIERALLAGREVKIRGFGTFYTSMRKARKGRNVRTGELVPIEERRVAKWLPAKSLRASVSGRTRPPSQ
jgi:nucleoid DNA-binding protein